MEHTGVGPGVNSMGYKDGIEWLEVRISVTRAEYAKKALFDAAASQGIEARRVGEIAGTMIYWVQGPKRPHPALKDLPPVPEGPKTEVPVGKIVTIHLDPGVIARVLELEAKVLGTDTLKRPNYTDLEAEGRYLKGYLGEFAVDEWLARNHVRRIFEPKPDGVSDKADFTVWTEGVEKLLDVKTAGEASHLRCMMPEAQYRARVSQLYVGARIVAPGTVEIHGWATRAELVDEKKWKVEMVKNRAGVETKTRWGWLAELRDPAKLIARLDKEGA